MPLFFIYDAFSEDFRKFTIGQRIFFESVQSETLSLYSQRPYDEGHRYIKVRASVNFKRQHLQFIHPTITTTNIQRSTEPRRQFNKQKDSETSEMYATRNTRGRESRRPAQQSVKRSPPAKIRNKAAKKAEALALENQEQASVEEASGVEEDGDKDAEKVDLGAEDEDEEAEDPEIIARLVFVATRVMEKKEMKQNWKLNDKKRTKVLHEDRKAAAF